jgi:argininosuccinate synthase
MSQFKKICLAYSGGLDTSIIIPWLKERYPGCEVIAVSVDIGQEEDWDAIKTRALASGASKIFIVNVRECFAQEFLFPMVRAGAIYEGSYLLGTSIARPLQAAVQVEHALNEGCDALAHGCTGKGNDQVRFELTYAALAPELAVIAPWREWDIESREDAIEFAEKHGIPIGNVSKKNIYSRDWNMWHMSHEGGEIEQLDQRPGSHIFKLTKSPQEAPDQETIIEVEFERGIPVGLNGKRLNGEKLIKELNVLAAENGIGRADVVETRTVGMKSRGIYETPAGTVLHHLLRDLENFTVDAESLHLRRYLAMEFAKLIYQGRWFTPYRENLEAFFNASSQTMTGTLKAALYKGNIIIVSRQSPFSLYDEKLASFGKSSYSHKDATGFIKLFELPVRVNAKVRKNLQKR